MYKFFGKVVLSFIIFAGASVLALDSEYKNTLNKIEFVKTGEDNYSVNLYTQKNYTQQPRIIKKSDYNYYILLPETKNSAPAAVKNSQDIRSVSANLYPYAGQDINNGYTKINISTTKPLNFNLSVKNSGTKAATATQTKATTTTAVKPPEKKTVSTPSSASSATKTAQTVTKLQPKQTVAKATTTVASTNKQAVQNTQVKKPQTQTATQQVKKPAASQPVKQNQIATTQTTAKKPQTPVQPAKPATKPVVKQEPPAAKPISQPVAKPVTKPEQDAPKPVVLPDDNSTKAPVIDVPEETQASYSQGEIFIPRANNASIEDDDMFKDDYSEFGQNAIFNWFRKNFNVSYFENIRNNVEYKLIQYGLDFSDVLWMIFAAIISLIVLIKICTKKQPQTAKLKTKADFMERKYRKPAVKTGKVPSKKKRIPYPATNGARTRKDGGNFELSKYQQPQVSLQKVEPQYNGTKFNNIPDKVTKPQYNLYKANNIEDIVEKAQQIERGESDVQIQKKMEAEADKQIIQNFGLNEEALELYNVNEPVSIQEESLSEIAALQNNEYKNEDIIQVQNEKQFEQSFEPQKQGLQQRLDESAQMQAPKKPAAQAQPRKEFATEIPGLKVLSSVEIAPERGFMCVSYNNNVSLVGYIFDDVFALHNFKVPKLHDYNIKFRLSERDNKGAYFIVKVDDSKLLIKVTKIAMALEVAM